MQPICEIRDCLVNGIDSGDAEMSFLGRTEDGKPTGLLTVRLVNCAIISRKRYETLLRLAGVES